MRFLRGLGVGLKKVPWQNFKKRLGENKKSRQKYKGADIDFEKVGSLILISKKRLRDIKKCA